MWGSPARASCSRTTTSPNGARSDSRRQSMQPGEVQASRPPLGRAAVPASLLARRLRPSPRSRSTCSQSALRTARVCRSRARDGVKAVTFWAVGSAEFWLRQRGFGFWARAGSHPPMAEIAATETPGCIRQPRRKNRGNSPPDARNRCVQLTDPCQHLALRRLRPPRRQSREELRQNRCPALRRARRAVHPEPTHMPLSRDYLSQAVADPSQEHVTTTSPTNELTTRHRPTLSHPERKSRTP